MQANYHQQQQLVLSVTVIAADELSAAMHLLSHCWPQLDNVATRCLDWQVALNIA